MNREDLVAKMKQLKAKARAARTEGKRDIARKFRAGALRFERRIRGLAKPPAPKTDG